MTNIHIGDNNATYGPNSPITTTHAGGSDEQTAIQELVQTIQVMRSHLSDAHQRIADDFLELSAPGTPAEKHRYRDALVRVGGIATVVGQVGVPVIDAIQKVTQALHL